MCRRGFRQDEKRSGAGGSQGRTRPPQIEGLGRRLMMPLIVPFFISHQGCPQQCVFCDQSKIAGAAETIPSPSEMLAKIADYRDSAGGRPLEAAFFGGTFTNLPESVQERILAPLQPLLARNELTSVRVSTRPDAIDTGAARFLREMGVGTVELGIQSMDDAVLSRSG